MFRAHRVYHSPPDSLARLHSPFWLAYSLARLYSGSPTSLARLPTLASIPWPALSPRYALALACLHYGFACSLVRILPGARSYDPTITRRECFELRREPPLRLRNCRRRCGSSAGCADLARLPKPHSARRERIHPSRAAGMVHAAVAQNVLKCNIFKTKFRTPTVDEVEGRVCSRVRGRETFPMAPRHVQMMPACLESILGTSPDRVRASRPTTEPLRR